MKSALWCFLILHCELIVLSLAYKGNFCLDSDRVIIITNKTAPDYTTFSVQQAFLRALVQNLTKTTVRLSLITFDREHRGEFIFHASFSDVPKYEFTPDMLTLRPNLMLNKSIRKVDDLFDPSPQLSFNLLVSLDVQLPLSFYPMQMNLSFLSEYGESYGYSSVGQKYYEIFTSGTRDIRFKRKYTSHYFGPIDESLVHQKNTVLCKDARMFQYHFQMILDNICAKNRVILNNLQKSKRLPPYLIKEDFKLLVADKSENIKVTLDVFDTRWMLVRYDTGNDMSKTCSKEGMSVLRIENKKQTNFRGIVMAYVLEVLQLTIWIEILVMDHTALMIGLRRRKTTVGRRFAWVDGKELTYSVWADGEPSRGDKIGCVVWTLDYPHVGYRHWRSAPCQGEGSVQSLIFCHDQETQKLTARLNVTQQKARYIFRDDSETKSYGKIYFKGNQQMTIKTSMSLALASGFEHNILQLNRISHGNDSLVLEGYVHDEIVTISQREVGGFAIEISNLFYRCDASRSSRSVPYSQVCDGVRDCRSGSDEIECETASHPRCSSREFACTSGQCVPLTTRCDLIRDCHDGSDEANCEMVCRHRTCGTGRCLPRSSFNDGQVDCSDGSDENVGQAEPCVLVCNRTECITREVLNDKVFDCKGPEGPIDETLGALQSFDCPQKGQSSYINNWAPMCVLAHDVFEEIIGCRDFSHLENCGNFACPHGYAKCPDSFCIPIAYLNDGKENCDFGEDEGPQDLEMLSNLFLCHPLRDQYVPISSVCDGRNDCSNGEDELDCEWACSPGFICLAGAISAARYKKELPPTDWSFINPKTRYMDISGVKVPDFFKIHPKQIFNHLVFLNLSRCGITDIRLQGKKHNSFNTKSGSRDFQALRTLDLSHNEIKRFGSYPIFDKLYSLKILNLSYNKKLTKLGTLHLMQNLRHIDLSFTSINQIRRNAFLALRSLKRLSLKQTRITEINFVLPTSLKYFNVEQTNIMTVSEDIFTKLRSSPDEIYSSSFKLCCPRILGPLGNSFSCHSPTTEVVFSCEDLVEESLLRVTLCLVGLATLVGNIITLVYRLTLDRKLLHKSYGLFVTNLGISDTLMGCYLVIIAVADLKFRGDYVLHDYAWRTSRACRTAGTIATLSSITSTMFIVLITFDRYLAVRFPFGEIRFTKQTMTAAVAGTWVFGTLLACVPLLPFAEDWEIYSGNGMCLGLPLRRERLPGWQYTVFMFVGLNFLLFLLIGAGQVAIFTNVRVRKRQETQRLNPQSQLVQNQRREEIAVAKRLALVAISNFICWFPIITLGLVTLFGVDVGAAAYRWSAVVVLPVNSALNPLLYTLPAIKKKLNEYMEERKLTKQHSRKTGKSDDLTARSLKNSCHSKIQLLKKLRLALNENEIYKICTFSELEIVYRKVLDVRASC